MPNQSKSDDPNYYVLGGSAVAAAALTYHMTKKDAPIDPLYDFENQSVEIDPVEHIRVNAMLKNKSLIEYRQADVRTLNDVLVKGQQVSGNGDCMGTREEKGVGSYIWLKYSEIIERVALCGSGLINAGINGDNSTRIGIYSSNRVEWSVAEYACYSFSFPVVSLYDSYGIESIKYILNHADIQVIFVDSYARMSNILKNVDDCPMLKCIVFFDKLDNSQIDRLKRESGCNLNSVKLIYFNDLLISGRENPVSSRPPKPTDVATICYTSGTTGVPKGAVISHGNIISAEAAIYASLSIPHLDYTHEGSTHMSYLPLAHMLERQAITNLFIHGGRTGFMSGDVTTLISDVSELKPTDMPMVPRLLNRFYNMVMNQVKTSYVKSALMTKAIAAKEKDRKRGIYRTNTIYDKLVFNKIRALFGGQIIHIATGSAPISDEVLAFNKAAFSCPIPEGYGQTEATCGITFTHPFDPTHGHVGPPVQNVMVKLVDVPEMGYFANKNQGEICARGPSVFQGYLKDEQKTRETIDENGWLHTGDIGMWLANGCLKIIDRKKNLFKLSQGEYISPEKIESAYAVCPFVGQIIVEGNSLKDYTVAIVVPEPVYFKDFCKKINLKGSFEELCKNKKIRQIILNELIKIGKESGLMSYEQIRNLYLHPEMFTIDNGLATPTMKIKRLAVRQHFKDTILGLYEECENSKRSKL